ncbi:actin organization and endocytosis protein [Tulasnella sp. 424]|nr:actin organization and endocytosis protein [Tulasnella sp. 424]KAG8977860.1 actin organization and endocytosis protein [Tulasnella sp. 425]
MNPQWQQQQQQRQQLQAPQQYSQPTGFGPQSSFLSPASPPTGFGPNSFQRPPPVPPVPPPPFPFLQAQTSGFASRIVQPTGFAGAGLSPLVAQPTGFGDPPMRMMPSPTFMPADTSMPYETGFSPLFAGPPQQTQGPSLQQSMQQHDRNVGGGPNIPWALSKDERKRYDDIFRAWDAQGTGFISGKTALEVFGQSGLSKDDLKQIWDLADSTNRGSLNMPEFRIAMSLIYRGLNGAPIPTVLPPELDPHSERDLGDSQNQRFGVGPKISWALSQDERKNYDKIFRTWDTQGTGFMSGKTALEAFGQSGLSKDDLKKIWDLADSTGRGSLNLPEFHVAMGLIYRVLNGAPIPTVLPPELVPPPSVSDVQGSVKLLKDILSVGSHGRASNGSSPNPQSGKIRSLHGTPAGDPLRGGRKDGTGYVQANIREYTGSFRHVDRGTVRYGGESPAAAQDEMKRQSRSASSQPDSHIEAENSRTREYDELEDQLHDLGCRVKRLREDLDRNNRGPPSIRRDEEHRRLERELLLLLHEKIPDVERKLEERDRDWRDRRKADTSRYGRTRSDRYDTYERDREDDYRSYMRGPYDRREDQDREREERDRGRNRSYSASPRTKSPPASIRSPPPG